MAATAPLSGLAAGDVERAAAPHLGYRPALDGVRAVAILGVLACHCEWLPSGYLGVDVFFALSGFLITSLLLEEHAATGRVALGLFYARRALRLLPALLGLLVTCSAVFLLTLPLAYAPLALQEAGAVLFYVANWAWLIGLPLGMYSHAWSLGIEEQFYLLWPLTLLALLRTIGSRWAITAVVLTLAGAGVAWRVALVRAGAPFEHVYQGLDAHGDGLLIGCAASLLLHLHSQASTLAALATALLVLHVVDAPRSRLARTLARRPLVALGRISYGVYLWHFPVFYWCGALAMNGWHPSLPAALLGWAATLVVAGASYVLVERPALVLKRRFAPA